MVILKRFARIETLVVLWGMIVLSFTLFSQGMFMDGTVYATVSSHLANGSSSLWQLHFSETLMNPFVEHPPLAIWLESLFHRVFIDSFLSERFYSLFTWMLNALLIMAIWKELKPGSKLSWLPLLLWVSTPLIIWSFSNNMLENTMGIFVSASVWFYLKGMKGKPIPWSLLSGIMLALAFLSKGFVGLFPLALPVLVVLFFGRSLFKQGILGSLMMLFGMALAILPFVLPEDGRAYLLAYFQNQVVGSVESAQTVPHRGQIIIDFFSEMAVPLFLIIVGFLWIRKGEYEQVTEENKRWGYILMLLVLCGVLPIMISLKQRGFYVLTVFPFACISLALFFEGVGKKLNFRWVEKRVKWNGWILGAGLVLLMTSIGSGFSYKRDREVLKSVDEVILLTGEDVTFNCSPSIRQNWGVMAYFSRYGNISMNHNIPGTYELRMSNEALEGDTIIGVFALKKLND